MKKILLLFTLFVGCKEEKKPDYGNTESTVTPIIKEGTPNLFAKPNQDTLILQEISYSKGLYILQTWVSAGFERIPICCKHPNPNKDVRISEKEGSYYRLYNGYAADDAPYCSEIVGTFDYIKNIKAREYNKALPTLLNIKKKGTLYRSAQKIQSEKEKAIQDSVAILKALPTNTGVYSDTSWLIEQKNLPK